MYLAIVNSHPNDQARWFAEFIQPHESMLRGWLRSRFGTQCDVDDLVQETYLRIAQARARGEVQAPKAFLFAAARNIALDQLRRLRTANKKLLAENEALHVFDDTADVAETVARNQELALLTEAIQTLPDRCRQIFHLAEGLRTVAQRNRGKAGSFGEHCFGPIIDWFKTLRAIHVAATRSRSFIEMTSSRLNADDDESIQDAAADWLMRRERGFTAAEQDEFLQWLGHDSRHLAWIAYQQKTWRVRQPDRWRADRSQSHFTTGILLGAVKA
jgi:RNA polymerase sigma-70 factor (ECF subfamily)